MWMIEPILQTKWILLICILLIASAVVQFLREGAGRTRVGFFLIRLSTILAVSGILLNPSVIDTNENEVKSNLVVLLDTSASMGTPDIDGRSRYDEAHKAVFSPQVLQSLTDGFNLEFYTFDKTVNSAGVSTIAAKAPEGRGSDLSGAIRNAVDVLSNKPQQPKGDTVSGILLVSDGRATSGEDTEAAQLALARSIPIWTLSLGGPVPPKDIRIETGSDEILAFGGTPAVLSGRVVQTGFADQSFRIELLEQDRVLQAMDILPAPGGDGRFRFEVTAPRSGDHRYVIRVESQPGEANPWNNQRAVFLRAVGQKVKVLVAEGQPHWDTKFLVQALKRHDRVDLTAVYSLGGGRYSAIVSKEGKAHRESDNLFPQTTREFFDYDVIILGRHCEIFFGDQTEDMLTRFVAQRGGGLIFSRGKAYGSRFSALAKLEPVVWDERTDAKVIFKLSQMGRSHASFDTEFLAAAAGDTSTMPLLDRTQRTRGKKPLAKVLAFSGPANGKSGNGNILMAYHRYGQGRVMTLNTGGIWRWAFQDGSGSHHDGAYSRFWLSMIRWLLSTGDFMPGEDIALSTDRRHYSEDDAVTLTIATKELPHENYRPVMDVRGPSFSESIRPTADADGNYTAVLGPFAPGTYHVVLGNNIGHPAEIRTLVEVTAAETEFKELSADPDRMTRIARISDGESLTPGDIGRLPKIVRKWQQDRRLSDKPRSAWDKWWILLVVVGLLGGEWYLRRRKDLL